MVTNLKRKSVASWQALPGNVSQRRNVKVPMVEKLVFLLLLPAECRDAGSVDIVSSNPDQLNERLPVFLSVRR